MVKPVKKLTIDQKLDSLIKFVKTDSTKQDKRIDTLETLLESLANFTTSNFHHVDGRFDRIDNTIKLLVEQGELNRADIQDLKRMVSQLVRNEARRDRFEIDTDQRLTKVEKHLKFV